MQVKNKENSQYFGSYYNLIMKFKFAKDYKRFIG